MMMNLTPLLLAVVILTVFAVSATAAAEYDDDEDYIDTSYHSLMSSDTIRYKSIERTKITVTYPDALEFTLANSGNYSSTNDEGGQIVKAGSPQWVGRTMNAQIYNEPTYTSFGSILALLDYPTTSTTDDNSSSSNTSTESIEEKMTELLQWISTLYHRRTIVQYHGEYNEEEIEYIKPCRLDLLDDNDDDKWKNQCVLGMDVDEITVVLHEGVDDNGGDEEEKMLLMGRVKQLAQEQFHIPMESSYFYSTLSEINRDGGNEQQKSFDTIIINTNNQDEMKLEHVITTYLKPGGLIYVMGTGPIVNADEYHYEDGPVEHVFGDVLNLLDSVKALSGVHPQRNPSANTIHRIMSRNLGLNVISSMKFPISYSFDTITSYLEEIVEWVDELDTTENRGGGEGGEGKIVPSAAMKHGYYQMCSDLLYKIEDLKEEEYEEAYTGGYDYVIAAQLPYDDDDESSDKKKGVPTVDEPTTYTPREKYEPDRDPTVEELSFPPIAPGVLQPYQWANGDAYDGMSARIGIPPQLKSTIIEYVKALGIWDIIIDTMTKNQLPPDSTKILEVHSPYSDQNFTWSIKRPDNFEGSSSDMHWFDSADEAAHEEGLRALAKGGFDEVLKAIGTHFGLDHLVSFNIGILAVTKADKGYVHVDFSHSGKRAANFLVNLQTPGDEPELTVIEEDDIGNRRRAQVKYQDEFGILNGDDAMHATNECDHRAYGADGVRITASIFLSELEEKSLKQVADHDEYYFPFGNMDWIWAQRGRHWNKDGTASMLNDKGRQPFEPKDAIGGCEHRVGKNKEKCLVHGEVRMRCYKTCGFFKSDDDYRPGSERTIVSPDLPF